MAWVAEVHPQRLLEAERALDHKIGNQVQRAYLRTDFLDQRRELAELWSRYLERRGRHLAMVSLGVVQWIRRHTTPTIPSNLSLRDSAPLLQQGRVFDEAPASRPVLHSHQ
jgi:hypothetical protein